jgi:flagellar secretion chaperone FliS
VNENNQLRAYKEIQIKTATPGRLIVMLYDGAIKSLNIAIEHMEKKDTKLDIVSNNIIKAQDIISELMVSLDFEKGGEIAKTLFALYMFMNRELLNGNVKKEMTPLVNVRKFLMDLREAWNEIADKNVAGENMTQRTGTINIAG